MTSRRPLASRTSRILRAGLSLLAAGVISGCSGSSPTASTDNSGARAAYLTQLDSAIENATNDGASRDQIDLMESSRDEGYLSPAVLHTALINYAICLEERGVELQEYGTSGPSEFPWFDYGTTTYGDSDVEWMDHCNLLELQEINALYQTQPRYRQVRQDLIDAHREEILSCLETAGRPLPDDATVDEITHEVFYANYGRYIDSSSEPAAEFQPLDCLSPTGIDWNDLIFNIRSPGFG